MASPRKPEHHKRYASHPDGETPEPERKKVIRMDVIAEFFLAILFVAALGFLLVDYQQGRTRRVIIWGCIAWIAAGVGIAARLYKTADGGTTDDPLRSTLEKLEAQQARELRPYMSVTKIGFTGLQVGKTPRVVITVTNTGRTPATSVKAVQRFSYLPIGGLVDRKYEGHDVDGSSGPLGNGQSIEMEFASHPMTQEEFDSLNDGMSELIAHGRVRYESPYIEGGSDDLLFCHQFDAASKTMILCRPLMAEFDPPKSPKKD